MEVIAHSKASPAPLPPPWLPGVHPGRLVRQAPPAAQADPAEGQRGIPQLVQQGHMDGGPAACPADPRALVPGVRGQGLADPGHGGGPCGPLPWGLGSVHQPGQPAEPVQVSPRPEDHARAGGAPGQVKREATPTRAGAQARARACASA